MSKLSEAANDAASEAIGSTEEYAAFVIERHMCALLDLACQKACDMCAQDEPVGLEDGAWVHHDVDGSCLAAPIRDLMREDT